MPHKTVDLLNGPVQEALVRSQVEVAGFTQQFLPEQTNPLAQAYKQLGIRSSILRDKK